ncbi:transcriptional repressor [Bacillus sonorensis]|nr:transcriptional repressor [Bacillus sonorensis]
MRQSQVVCKARSDTGTPYGSGKSKYELVKRHHYHVICKSCGKIVDLDYPF